MRRALEILFQVSRATGHLHPHLQAVVNNYEALLEAMGIEEAGIDARLRELAPDFFADKEEQSH